MGNAGRFHYAVAIAALAFVGSPTLASPTYRTKYPHFQPEAVYKAKTGQQVRYAISTACLDSGLSVESSDQNGVTCSYSTAGDQLLLLTTPRYSTSRGILRFNVTELDGEVRVIASDKILVTTAFGQVTERRGTRIGEPAGVLAKSGGIDPVGTKYPGIDLGFDMNDDNQIVSVVADGPADLAGVKAGDALKRINGKSFNGIVEMRWKLDKTTAGVPIALHVQRGKENLILTATGRQKPPAE